MNFKLLFPVYRSRYKWIEKTLAEVAASQKFPLALSLGCGEGEGDPCLAFHSEKVYACDINADDVAYAKSINRKFEHISYCVDDATALSFESEMFDLVVSSEVIEHVGQPADRLIKEVARVLKPNAIAIITYPSKNFPITYDPINTIASFLGKERLIPWGAYAFGHDYLIDNELFRNWCEESQLEIIKDVSLSGYLVGLLEMYWTGVLQAIFKKNAKNLSTVTSETSIAYRPSYGDPTLGLLTSFVLWIDKTFFLRHDKTVLKGFVLRKKNYLNEDSTTTNNCT
jgi:2-polyprenyl-3-methyl-5-hydroxy-6-metoxy-1,4-benzoquinol methylase